jgi:hypothetical protein
MRRLVIQISLFVVFVLIAYLGLFQREFVKGWFGKMTREAKGYTPAETPREALDKFREAVANRDYDAAATYCGGDYAEVMRKSAKAAEELGKAIDNLQSNMDAQGVQSDRARLVLMVLEPFPTKFKVGEIKQQGEDRAYATVLEDTGAPLRLDGRYENWNLDPLMLRSLARGLTQHVELRREGQGDKKYWKIYFPVTPILNLSSDQLVQKYQNYVRALDKVKYEVKNDPVTKSDVERRLKAELEEAK